MSNTDVLFTPVQVGELTLPNRIVLAPLTRSRAGQPGNVPTPLMAEYYTQRAGAGLIISEATNISQIAMGYALTPGIFTREQTDGWRRVTESVHAAGGRMFLQLWHCGRMSHESLHPGEAPVAPSAIHCDECQVFVVDADGRGGPSPVSPPRELSVDEIRATVQDYASATRNALDAGFDGVEVHAANGYLIHQFLASNTNQRSDQYGGSLENRCRFLFEVMEAVLGEIPAGTGGGASGAPVRPQWHRRRGPGGDPGPRGGAPE